MPGGQKKSLETQLIGARSGIQRFRQVNEFGREDVGDRQGELSQSVPLVFSPYWSSSVLSWTATRWSAPPARRNPREGWLERVWFRPSVVG
jgi:hypothetical protein